MLQKKGEGLDGRKETACNRIHCDDTTSAFDSRIRTGVITNLNHKDPASFLKDCFALFKRRINNALKKEAAVKVNTVFGGEFVMTKGDRVQMEHKTQIALWGILEWNRTNMLTQEQEKAEVGKKTGAGWDRIGLDR
ncbi:hypothetical protein NQ315_013880 [Exocentrus adspersus]|uniref:Uncharacterized protein n=1 Tax=Exocentrus adspersus TaxID=1586481 RepID=A0AAV8V8M0_9CUCU|nr:hypothetical protein NQ315_013880 [Exocentrus adspersus]